MVKTIWFIIYRYETFSLLSMTRSIYMAEAIAKSLKVFSNNLLSQCLKYWVLFVDDQFLSERSIKMPRILEGHE